MKQAGPATLARTVSVDVDPAYPVWITRGGSAVAGVFLDSLSPPLTPTGWVLVSDRRVAGLHAATLRRGLAGWPEPLATLLLPEGERAKTWRVVGAALRRLARARLDRGGLVLCLGGGSVGDVGGFVAGTYLRGLPFVNAPTTLLAMVDASIGGKTGVNLPEGKNLVGVFHQPRAVLADLDLLRTLPSHEMRNGWAEAIKIAITSDPELFELLERRAPLQDEEALEAAVERSSRAKAAIVSADEREAGPRTLLNFGHTVGHAVEAAGGFRRWSHGESVALGISSELELGVRLGVTPATVARRCRDLLGAYDLPTGGSGIRPETLIPFLSRDKKSRAGTVAVWLTVEIGRPILRPLSSGDPDLSAAIASIA